MIPQKSRSIDEQPRELVWLKQVPTLRDDTFMGRHQ